MSTGQVRFVGVFHLIAMAPDIKNSFASFKPFLKRLQTWIYPNWDDLLSQNSQHFRELFFFKSPICGIKMYKDLKSISLVFFLAILFLTTSHLNQKRLGCFTRAAWPAARSAPPPAWPHRTWTASSRWTAPCCRLGRRGRRRRSGWNTTWGRCGKSMGR